MKKTSPYIVIALLAISMVSCDKDYNTIGTGLVDEVHFNIEERSDFSLNSETISLGGDHPVQTNNLPYNVLGYYNDPVYGTTTASILAQVELSEYGMVFEDDAVLTKAVLSIPYYNELISSDEDGVGTYELDSVYGATAINLKMYKSDYYLNNFDPGSNFEDIQKYYSNAHNLTGIEGQLLYENTDFLPTNEEVLVTVLDDNGEEDITRLAPRLRDETSLDLADFAWILDPANTENISTSNNFRNFYRGMYFKATALGAEGVLVGLDMGEVEIELTYEFTDEDGELQEDTIKMLFYGNTINTFDNNFTYTQDTDKLYLKGGEGAMAMITLFAPDEEGFSEELEEIKAENWIINDAFLEFHVAQEVTQGGETEPERIFLYNIDDEKVLIDYVYDQSENSDVNFSKTNHLGKLERDDDGNGVKYSINITEHLTDVIKKDSTNVKFGLVVSNNVKIINNSSVKDSETLLNGPKSVLSSSVNAHRGTVLYNENAIAEDKKLKLKMIYTK